MFGKSIAIVTVVLLCTISTYCPIGTASVSSAPESISVNVDGTVTPIDAPVELRGNTYTITGGIAGLSIAKSDIVIDGNGHSSDGVTLYDVSNVTIKNFVVNGDAIGVCLYRATGCLVTNNTVMDTHVPVLLLPTGGIYIDMGNSNIITGNRVSNNQVGIFLGSTQQNTFSENVIKNNLYGVANFNSEASDNRFFLNDFANNSTQVDMDLRSFNVWDNEGRGNYWSDYNGTDVNEDGIGDTPYVIESNQSDNYPLVKPFSQIEIIEKPAKDSNLFVLVAAVSAVSVLVAVVSLIVYFKRQRRK